MGIQVDLETTFISSVTAHALISRPYSLLYVRVSSTFLCTPVSIGVVKVGAFA